MPLISVLAFYFASSLHRPHGHDELVETRLCRADTSVACKLYLRPPLLLTWKASHRILRLVTVLQFIMWQPKRTTFLLASGYAWCSRHISSRKTEIIFFIGELLSFSQGLTSPEWSPKYVDDYTIYISLVTLCQTQESVTVGYLEAIYPLVAFFFASYFSMPPPERLISQS